jgi:hypothetical protein
MTERLPNSHAFSKNLRIEQCFICPTPEGSVEETEESEENTDDEEDQGQPGEAIFHVIPPYRGNHKSNFIPGSSHPHRRCHRLHQRDPQSSKHPPIENLFPTGTHRAFSLPNQPHLKISFPPLLTSFWLFSALISLEFAKVRSMLGL